jgi:subtilisin family serine protease
MQARFSVQHSHHDSKAETPLLKQEPADNAADAAAVEKQAATVGQTDQATALPSAEKSYSLDAQLKKFKQYRAKSSSKDQVTLVNSSLQNEQGIIEERNILARSPEAVVILERSVPLPSGQIKRERLLKTEMKYPLIKVEEVVIPQKGNHKEKGSRGVAMVADHVIVMPKEGVTEAEFLQQVAATGGTVLKKQPLSGNYIVSYANADLDTVTKAIKLLSNEKVNYVEPDYIVFASLVPNDMRFPEMWGLDNNGQSSGLTDADIDAPEAWNRSTGSRSVLVGVIDSGIDYTHPDLQANMWTNPGEIAGNNIDDDGNGYVDDIRGWDFANEDNDPIDDNNHGTHCAGTIGAVGNNAVGVTGVCWQVSLVGLKFLSSSNRGATSDGIEATAYATRLGCTLTSNSWVGGGYSQGLYNAINAANIAGIPFIAAAGNTASDNDSLPNYPSNYDLPNVIAVASTTRSDLLSNFSCYGASSVDLAAPGSSILSSVPGAKYSLFNGTSMATPHVAGAMALLKSYKPSLQSADLIELIMNSVDPLTVLEGKMVSGGRLNVDRTLVNADSMTVSTGSFIAVGDVGGPFTPSKQIYTVKNRSASAISWLASANVGWATVSPSGGVLAPGESMQVMVNLHSSVVGLANGTYLGVVNFQNSNSNTNTSRNLKLQVGKFDYFTQLFDTGVTNDLGNKAITFTPSANRSKYTAVSSTRSSYYTDPAGGVDLPLDDDDHQLINLSTPVKLYGVDYHSVYIHSNGYLTFTQADSSNLASLSSHFSLPRVSGLMDDLNPAAGGRVSYRVLTDRLVVTWNHVPQYALTDSNSFQVELFYAGVIRITWLDIDATDGLAGLSEGRGLQPDYSSSDLSSYLPVIGRLVTPLHAVESDGILVGQASVVLNNPSTSELSITLESSAPDIVTLPSLVTIPALSNSVIFDISVVNNSQLDGTRIVNMIANSALGSFQSSMQVHDDEVANLSVTGPASVTEGDAPVQGIVSVSSAVSVPVTVYLSSSDTTEVKIPISVIIPAGQTSVTIPISVQDDTQLDGTETVTITARVEGWGTGTHTLEVVNNELPTLELTLPATLAEGIDTAVASITLGGSVNTNTLVNLSVDDDGLSVPATVTVPASSRTVSFQLRVIDDFKIDDNLTVTVTASAPGFGEDTAITTIEDDDPETITLLPLASFYNSGEAFTITAQALDANGVVMTNYSGSAVLSVKVEGLLSSIYPTQVSFVNGVCTQQVVIQDLGSATITLTDEAGRVADADVYLLDAQPDYYTQEVFGNHLDYQSFTFVPYGNRYRVKRDVNIKQFPVELKNNSDFYFNIVEDDSEEFRLSGSKTVKLFGACYRSIYISENGYVTFAEPENTHVSSLDKHFDLPRVSVSFADHSDSFSGRIYANELAYRVVVTWKNIGYYSDSTKYSNMQLELYFNGVIRITLLNIQADSYIIGLSHGEGIPLDFFQTNFAAYPTVNLQLAIDEASTEGQGDLLSGMVDLGHAAGGVVKLIANPANDLILPVSVTVPVGRSSIPFSFRVIDDCLLEGAEHVTVQASYAGRTAMDSVSIIDNETAGLLVVIHCG